MMDASPMTAAASAEKLAALLNQTVPDGFEMTNISLTWHGRWHLSAMAYPVNADPEELLGPCFTFSSENGEWEPARGGRIVG